MIKADRENYMPSLPTAFLCDIAQRLTDNKLLILG
jgi:hypothetical protein